MLSPGGLGIVVRKDDEQVDKAAGDGWRGFSSVSSDVVDDGIAREENNQIQATCPAERLGFPLGDARTRDSFTSRIPL